MTNRHSDTNRLAFSINRTKHSDERVCLQLAQDDRGYYWLIADSGEDTETRYNTVEEATEWADRLWGGPEWAMEWENVPS
jgi:hypothetical protein